MQRLSEQRERHIKAYEQYGDIINIGIFIAEQPAPAPHLAHPEGCATLRIVLATVPRVSRACERLPDGFDLYLLQMNRRNWLGHSKFD